jgi:hypothetical protein
VEESGHHHRAEDVFIYSVKKIKNVRRLKKGGRKQKGKRKRLIDCMAGSFDMSHRSMPEF